MTRVYSERYNRAVSVTGYIQFQYLLIKPKFELDVYLEEMSLRNETEL